jgi:hypothetical protein
VDRHFDEREARQVRRQLGWLAAGTVLFLAGILGLAILLARSGREAQASNPAVLPGRPVADDPSVDRQEHEARERQLARVAGHRFWQVRVTPEQVADWVRQIRAEQRSSMVYLDDQGRLFIKQHFWPEYWTNPREDTRPAYRTFVHDWRPAGLGQRYIFLDLKDRFTSRPSTESVLSALLAALDVKDYN